MMELGDMPVLETGAAMHAGSTTVIGTLPLSSKDRTSGYEPRATEQSEGCERVGARNDAPTKFRSTRVAETFNLRG